MGVRDPLADQKDPLADQRGLISTDLVKEAVRIPGKQLPIPLTPIAQLHPKKKGERTADVESETDAGTKKIAVTQTPSLTLLSPAGAQVQPLPLQSSLTLRRKCQI